MFLGWYDPDKKKQTAAKLNDAIARYERKWGRAPHVALVHPGEEVEIDGIEVRVAAHVPPNTFFVGDDEADEAAQLAA